MGFVRSSGSMILGALSLQVPIQYTLCRYPLMPDTLPQPWYVRVSFAMREYVFQYIEYPAIQLADLIFRAGASLNLSLSVLFMSGALCVFLVLWTLCAAWRFAKKSISSL